MTVRSWDLSIAAIPLPEDPRTPGEDKYLERPCFVIILSSYLDDGLTGHIQLGSRMAALRRQSWSSPWSWRGPAMFWYFPAMFLSVRTFLALFFHLCVGALGGRGGGEGVLVKGREGNAGKDGS